jgi:hypothetical protein
VVRCGVVWCGVAPFLVLQGWSNHHCGKHH